METSSRESNTIPHISGANAKVAKKIVRVVSQTNTSHCNRKALQRMMSEVNARRLRKNNIVISALHYRRIYERQEEKSMYRIVGGVSRCGCLRRGDGWGTTWKTLASVLCRERCGRHHPAVRRLGRIRKLVNVQVAESSLFCVIRTSSKLSLLPRVPHNTCTFTSY